ncbi:MAG: HAD family phosphatase [Peptoniphilaceae bacterium]|nr:HAD family phosphatase [Peptoniphilaceae bacterium]MDD7383212.1 HAD family phosphatase [Peptoniphilaceae bacterium]MDY3738436.1 HAD family phosphatase [Peptoniphilaceae bacterium]
MKILFDCDGTLLDSMFVWEKPYKELFKKYNYIPTKEEYDEIQSYGMSEFCEFVINKFNLKLSKREVSKKIYKVIEYGYKNDVKPKNGIVDFLDKLYEKNIEMAVTSSSDLKLLDVVFEKYKMNKYFKFILTPDSSGLLKSEKEYWLKAMKLLNSDPKSTILFDDASYAIKTAKSVGIYTIGVKDLPYNEKEIPILEEIADELLDNVTYFDINSIKNF